MQNTISMGYLTIAWLPSFEMSTPSENLPPSDTSKIVGLRARGILVDMEESVVGGNMRSRLGKLFEEPQCITSQSGSGNNWAVGYHHYGLAYRDRLLDSIRLQAEHCDSLQSFFICHSIGGGTGSGLGSYILEMLADEFPDVYRFSTCIFSGADDDVITSPYNSVLTLNKLNSYSDCVLPVENQALFEICNRIQTIAKTPRIAKDSLITTSKNMDFDAMNDIVAKMLLNLTSSMRFEGSLNVDINEIAMNMVPFPRLKYLISSISPLFHHADVKLQYSNVDHIFAEAFRKDNFLVTATPSTYIACGVLARGNLSLSDIQRNIKNRVEFVSWNKNAWKIGICDVPLPNLKHSLLVLANNCCIYEPLSVIHEKFRKLYKRKAHVHHYTEYMDETDLEVASLDLGYLIGEYQAMNSKVSC